MRTSLYANTRGGVFGPEDHPYGGGVFDETKALGHADGMDVRVRGGVFGPAEAYGGGVFDGALALGAVGAGGVDVSALAEKIFASISGAKSLDEAVATASGMASQVVCDRRRALAPSSVFSSGPKDDAICTSAAAAIRKSLDTKTLKSFFDKKSYAPFVAAFKKLAEKGSKSPYLAVCESASATYPYYNWAFKKLAALSSEYKLSTTVPDMLVRMARRDLASLKLLPSTAQQHPSAGGQHWLESPNGVLEFVSTFWTPLDHGVLLNERIGVAGVRPSQPKPCAEPKLSTESRAQSSRMLDRMLQWPTDFYTVSTVEALALVAEKAASEAARLAGKPFEKPAPLWPWLVGVAIVGSAVGVTVAKRGAKGKAA